MRAVKSPTNQAVNQKMAAQENTWRFGRNRIFSRDCEKKFSVSLGVEKVRL